MRLLQEDVILKGEILYCGKNLYSIEKDAMRKLRGKEIGVILQNPGSSLNPGLTVGSQIAEPIMLHKKVKGNTEREDDVDVIAKGMVKMYMLDFLKQLTTFRVKGADPVNNLKAFADFNKMFLGTLYDIYAPKLSID